MDRGEPTLKPEWLKNNGKAGGSGNNQSLFRSVEPSKSKHSRHKSFNNSNERDIRRSSILDQTTSPYLRCSSSNKDSSRLRSRGSSARHYHDRVSDNHHDFWDKEKSGFGVRRYSEYADHSNGVLLGRSNKDILRHSKSMISQRSDGSLPRRGSGDLTDGSSNNHINSNTVMVDRATVPSSTQAALGKDFPSLRTEHEEDSSGLRRTPSPGLPAAAATQSFPIASSNMICTEGWTSSLAEVPGPIRSSSTGPLSSQQSVLTRVAPLTDRPNGLNMAEAVVQNPSRARTPPQLSVDTQRLEDLAIKQSKQLIPVTPSMPKSNPFSPLDKSKPKAMLQSPFTPARLDPPKPSNPGLQILKSSRELNGVSSTLMEKSGPINGFNSLASQSPSGASAPNRKSNPANNQAAAAPDRRTTAPSSGNLEKRPSFQGQSRQDFLKQMRNQQSSARTGNTPSLLEKSRESIGEVASPEAAGSVLSGSKEALPTPGYPTENGGKMTENGKCMESGGQKTEVNGVCGEAAKYSGSDVPPPDEKEAEFLRSLGWEESGEQADEGLTEEEIRSFYERHTKTSQPPEFPRLQLGTANGNSLPNGSGH